MSAAARSEAAAGPLVVYLRDAAPGELDVFAGTSHAVIRDPALDRQLHIPQGPAGACPPCHIGPLSTPHDGDPPSRQAARRLGNPLRPGFPNGRRVFDDVAFPYLGVPYSGFNVS